MGKGQIRNLDDRQRSRCGHRPSSDADLRQAGGSLEEAQHTRIRAWDALVLATFHSRKDGEEGYHSQVPPDAWKEDRDLFHMLRYGFHRVQPVRGRP